MANPFSNRFEQKHVVYVDGRSVESIFNEAMARCNRARLDGITRNSVLCISLLEADLFGASKFVTIDDPDDDCKGHYLSQVTFATAFEFDTMIGKLRRLSNVTLIYDVNGAGEVDHLACLRSERADDCPFVKAYETQECLLYEAHEVDWHLGGQPLKYQSVRLVPSAKLKQHNKQNVVEVNLLRGTFVGNRNGITGHWQCCGRYYLPYWGATPNFLLWHPVNGYSVNGRFMTTADKK